LPGTWDPGGFAVARRGAGKRAPKGRIGRVHGILEIPCGHTDVWLVREGKALLGFGRGGRRSTLCLKGAEVGQGLADGEVDTRIVNKRHDRGSGDPKGLREQKKKRA
jgi:hypothetical protein